MKSRTSASIIVLLLAILPVISVASEPSPSGEQSLPPSDFSLEGSKTYQSSTNTTQSPESTSIVSERAFTRLIGGVWALGNVTGPLTVTETMSLPPGENFQEFRTIIFDPESGEIVYESFLQRMNNVRFQVGPSDQRMSGVEAKVWYRDDQHTLDHQVYASSDVCCATFNWTIPMDVGYAEGHVLMHLRLSTAATEMSYEIEGLPADSVRLDERKIMAGWGEMPSEGILLQAGVATAGTRQGVWQATMEKCTYGSLGVVRNHVATLNESLVVSTPTHGVRSFEVPWITEYAVLAAPAHDWRLEYSWTGLASGPPLPYVGLFEGQCPDQN